MPRNVTPASDIARAPVQTTSGKERILNAAMLLFARMPYSDTSLRDIAAAAEVDVAYVHRAFGSKAEIFRHALLALEPIDDIATGQPDGATMIRRICNLAFLRNPRKLEDVRPGNTSGHRTQLKAPSRPFGTAPSAPKVASVAGPGWPWPSS